MAHWHDFNPWAARCIYISEEAMTEALAESGQSLDSYGYKLDAYILPQVDGSYSFGIRYGAEGNEYLSPPISDQLGEKFEKLFGRKA